MDTNEQIRNTGCWSSAYFDTETIMNVILPIIVCACSSLLAIYLVRTVIQALTYFNQPRIVYRQVSRKEVDEQPELTLIIGPMFSGKTGEVIKRLHILRHKGESCLIIKHNIDTRYNETGNCHALRLTTHDQTSFEIANTTANFELLYVADLADLTSSKLSEYKTVVLEEAHMFRDNWWPFVQRCLLDAHCSVIVSTIDSYAPEERFPQAIDNLADAVIWANTIIKNNSVCPLCHQQLAVFTLSKNKRLAGHSPIDVGGEDKYQPSCIYCHFQSK